MSMPMPLTEFRMYAVYHTEKEMYYNYNNGDTWQGGYATTYNIDEAIQKRRSLTDNYTPISKMRIHRIKIKPRIKQIDVLKI